MVPLIWLNVHIAPYKEMTMIESTLVKVFWRIVESSSRVWEDLHQQVKCLGFRSKSASSDCNRQVCLDVRPGLVKKPGPIRG